MPDRPSGTDASNRQAAADGGYFGSLTLARYMRLTTFKRDGIPVSCTVRGVVDGDSAYFRSRNQSGTVKRLRHTDAVQVAPCGALGFCSYGPPLNALARRLPDEEASVVAAELDRKYPVRRRFVTRLLRSQAVYYQLAADDVAGDQDEPPGGLARLIIRVNVTRGSVDGNAATPTSLAIKSRSCPPDHTRIVTVTMSPPAGLPGQAGGGSLRQQ